MGDSGQKMKGTEETKLFHEEKKEKEYYGMD